MAGFRRLLSADTLTAAMNTRPPPSGTPPRVPLGSSAPLLFAVDDEPFNLELIKRALRGAYRIRTFDNPLQAVAAAREEAPQVVLTDYRMPHMNGLNLVRSLKQAGINVVSLLVTAYVDTEEVVKAQQAESLFVRIIPKPWKAMELRAQVDLAVGLYNLHVAKKTAGETDDEAG